MDTLRWGLLSTARINRRFIPAVLESLRSELVAVASRNAESAESYAAQWDIPRAFPSYDTMLESGEVDAVYISLPNHLHAEWTIRALDAGVHVLCEKPFALTLQEVDDMVAAAERNGRVLSEAFMYRHHPQTKTVGEWVRDGRLGDLSVIRGVFNFKMTTTDNIRLVPELGGGSLWDIGVYPMSFAQYLVGEAPEWVTAGQWLGPTGVDNSFVGQMHYRDGTMAQISSAFRSPLHTHMEIMGTKGRLEINKPFTGLHEDDARVTFVDEHGESSVVTMPRPYLYLGEVEDMETTVLDGAEPYLSLAETRDHVLTALALYESARTGERVYLAEIDG